ncbi:hypothetical protein NECID01_0682 [Nematocida sp. AWRm77]|nr:hypothetical protein NECID01_0682 [Nematocida sp. AWRm77]
MDRVINQRFPDNYSEEHCLTDIEVQEQEEFDEQNQDNSVSTHDFVDEPEHLTNIILPENPSSQTIEPIEGDMVASVITLIRIILILIGDYLIVAGNAIQTLGIIKCTSNIADSSIGLTLAWVFFIIIPVGIKLHFILVYMFSQSNYLGRYLTPEKKRRDKVHIIIGRILFVIWVVGTNFGYHLIGLLISKVHWHLFITGSIMGRLFGVIALQYPFVALILWVTTYKIKPISPEVEVSSTSNQGLINTFIQVTKKILMAVTVHKYIVFVCGMVISLVFLGFSMIKYTEIVNSSIDYAKMIALCSSLNDIKIHAPGASI